MVEFTKFIICQLGRNENAHLGDPGGKNRKIEPLAGFAQKVRHSLALLELIRMQLSKIFAVERKLLNVRSSQTV